MPMTAEATAHHSLLGASALVAGATGGLGRAIADELHTRGATLTLVGCDARRLDDLGLPGTHHVADLRSAQACADAVAAVREPLDVVVSAVGVVAFGTVAELSPEVLAELFAVNVFVPILLARAALPVLAPPRGDRQPVRRGRRA
jgi:cyclic-di-GMP-binding biofilm dispersal mediator protein